MHSAARLISRHLSRLTAVHCLDALEMINFDLFLHIFLFFSFSVIYVVMSVIALMTNKMILYHGQGSMVCNHLASGTRLETGNLWTIEILFHF